MSLQAERSLFEACADLPAGDRAAWLASHCDDPALRERVLRLLQAHDAASSAATVPPAAALLTERRIGPYRLLEQIGEGAMGEVWLAEQTAPVLRRVALKLIKQGMDSREVIARFELERQSLAVMSHPSIAHIIDAGATSRGQPYFAMEYVPGLPLNRYCDQHRLSLAARLQLFLQICDAVQHAHQKGVIHRDLKPGNLLVMEQDGRPVPKIIDFGIAKAIAPGQQASNAHTRIGHLIGTPEYMSPEQAQLSPLDVDTRSDVYSLGVVLHELLTGSLPFATSSSASTPAEIVKELLSADPEAPSTRVSSDAPEIADFATRRASTPSRLAAQLTGDLDWIVLKTLEKDRNRRYSSPSELAADIRRHLANEPVLAGPPSAVYRMRKFVQRHRLGVAVVAGLFVSALGFGALMAVQAREIARQRDEATYQAQRAEASSEFMSLMLEEVGPEGRPLTQLELLGRGLQLLDRQYGADPRFAARMLLQIARRYMDLEDTDTQFQVLARAGAIARDLHDDELLAAVECATVFSEISAGRSSLAAQHIATAQEALSRIEDVPLATQVDCQRAGAEVAKQARDWPKATSLLTQAQALLEAAGNTKGLAYNAVLTDLGGVYFVTGRFREALELNRLTMDALDRNGRGGTFARATVTGNRASLLYRVGEVKAAEAVGAEVAERLRSIGGSRPASPAAGVSYAIALIRMDKPQQALELLTSSAEQARNLGNETWSALAHYHLGRTYLSLQQLDTAATHLAEAERIWLTNETASHDRLLELARTRAELDLASGRVPIARDRVDATLRQLGYPAQRDAPGLTNCLTLASRIYLRGGNADEALRLATDSLAIAESVARDPRQSADVGEALLALAAARGVLGDAAAARSNAERAVQALSNGLGPEHRTTREAMALLKSA
ncbi:MAG: serine/threonine-protein kinase [Pseudomonadota bacterium]